MCLNYVELNSPHPITYPEPKVGFKVMERLGFLGDYGYLPPFQGDGAYKPGEWAEDRYDVDRKSYFVPEDFDHDFDSYCDLDYITYRTGYHIWVSGQDAIDCLEASIERQMSSYRRDNWVVVRVEYNDVVATGTQATDLLRVGERGYYSGSEGRAVVARKMRVMEEYWDASKDRE